MTNEELAGMFTSTTVAPTTIYDVHIAALQTLDKELERLHKTLNFGDGDDDTTQEQITQIISEIARLSEQLADAETENVRNK